MDTTQTSSEISFFNFIIHVLIRRLTVIPKMTFPTLKNPFLREENSKILLRPEKTLKVFISKKSFIIFFIHGFET
jgi:hypothetical protein